MRGITGGDEPKLGEAERVTHLGGGSQMSVVHRIEGAAEESENVACHQ